MATCGVLFFGFSIGRNANGGCHGLKKLKAPHNLALFLVSENSNLAFFYGLKKF